MYLSIDYLRQKSRATASQLKVHEKDGRTPKKKNRNQQKRVKDPTRRTKNKKKQRKRQG